MEKRPSTSALHRTVRLTARTSALLFTASRVFSVLHAAQLVPDGPRADRVVRTLYSAFMAAHAAHFSVVARYAVRTGGRNLFPGGRSMQDVGGWPTLLGIYSLFAGLAIIGRAAETTSPSDRSRTLGRTANTVIGAMFLGTYLGQLAHIRRARGVSPGSVGGSLRQ
jgi:hypothetical protein